MHCVLHLDGHLALVQPRQCCLRLADVQEILANDAGQEIFIENPSRINQLLVICICSYLGKLHGGTSGKERLRLHKQTWS